MCCRRFSICERYAQNYLAEHACVFRIVNRIFQIVAQSFSLRRLFASAFNPVANTDGAGHTQLLFFLPVVFELDDAKTVEIKVYAVYLIINGPFAHIAEYFYHDYSPFGGS